uniref:Uncharacterized protein n=1 Tax=Anabas testudineus TaxID=64144 RepID=A0A7N6BHZ3_ANATE
MKILNSINDLKKINFGQSVPKHSLLLLHWFANKVSIVNNNVIWLNFDPNNRDYGSHHYGNSERVLDPLPQGHRYYTVGNINQDNSLELPSYVVNHGMEDIGENMARIIIRVSDRHPNIADQVYITQHYEADQHQGTEYDPEHTYEVTTDILREIREFSVSQNQRHSLSDSRLMQVRFLVL